LQNLLFVKRSKNRAGGLIAARRICCHLLVNIANQESWKNDNGDYETRTEWLEGTLRYREVEDEVKGTTFKHRITEVHATGMKRLSKIEGADDPSDGTGGE
jgi:single-strand DNA-binding protein